MNLLELGVAALVAACLLVILLLQKRWGIWRFAWGAGFLVLLVFGAAYLYLFFGRAAGDINLFYQAGESLKELRDVNLWWWLRMTFGPCATPLDPALYPYAYESNFWNWKSHYFMVRYHALFPKGVLGSIYVHQVVWAALLTSGGIAWMKSLRNFYPNIKLPFLWLGVFGSGSALLWVSGMHKDGVVFACLGWIALGLTSTSKKHWHWLFVALAALYIVIIVKPILVAFIVAGVLLLQANTRKQRFFTLATLGIIGLIGLHVAGLDVMSTRHIMYIDENFGNPDMGHTPWSADWLSVIQFIPQAAKNGLIEPLPWNAAKSIQLLTSIELLGIWGFVMVSILYNRAFWKQWKTGVIAGCALGYMLMLGMMVVNYGSMARYRSLPILVLLSLAWAAFGSKRSQSETV